METMFQTSFDFDGETYNRTLDQKRLTGQWKKVWNVMVDGKWRTLEQISIMTGGLPTQSISARLRDFKKKQFGRHDVPKRRRGDQKLGIWEYKLIPNCVPKLPGI